MLDAWVIEEIRRREGGEPAQVPLQLPVPEEDRPEASPDPEPERGVVVVDL